MRTIIIFMFLGQVINLFAQCDNNVSTDYLNGATNNALPSVNPNAYLNSFDWVPRDPNTLELQKYNTYGINQGLLLPNGQINNIYSSQVSDFYKYLGDEIEPLPENGWELISVNMGFYPNNVRMNSEYNDFPYLILYNRYRGIIRVFGILGPGYAAYGTSINAVVVNLGLNNKENLNGLFRLSSGFDQALDKTTDIQSVAAICEHQNANGKWFSADFQVAYDPCVCFWKSEITTDFKFIEKQDVKLNINAISVNQNLIDGTLVDDNVDFLNNFNLTNISPSENEASEGYVIYKAIEHLIDDYVKRLEHYEAEMDAIGQYNKKIKRNKWILKAISIVIKTGAFVVSGPGGAAVVSGLMQYAPEILTNAIGGLDPKLLSRESLTAIGEELTTFIGDNFFKLKEITDLPTSPIQPTAVFTQMNAVGSITESTNITGPTFLTPGTYGGQYVDNSVSNPPLNSPHEYPVYNEALGQFALLKSPKIKLYKGQINKECSVQNPSGNNIDVHLQFDYLQQFQLLEPLEFVLNSALDIESYSIDLSLGTSTESKIGNIDNSGLTLMPFAIVKPELTANVESIQYDLLSGNNNQIANSVEFVSSNDISSPFIPKDAFTNVVSSLGTHHFFDYHLQGNLNTGQQVCNTYLSDSRSNLVSYNRVEFKTYFLKIRVKIKYITKKSDGSNNEYVYLFTYKIDKDNIETEATQIADINMLNTNNLSNYSEDLFLYNTNFNGDYVEGYILDGTTYNCQAWNNVYVKGDLQVISGYNVNVTAANEIYFEPESNNPPEMIFSIKSILDFSSPMPLQTNSEVYNFCADKNLYNARNPTKKVK